MTIVRCAVVLLALLLGSPLAQAQTVPPNLPAGFTQQQFDDLVEAISRSVAGKLKEQQAGPKPEEKGAPATKEAAAGETLDESAIAAGIATFIDRAGKDLKAAPEFFATYAGVPAALDRSAEGDAACRSTS